MPPARTHGGRGGAGRRRGGGGHGGGGEEEGGSERWLVTYADMLTLLLVLFIVLFSISVVNTSKYISLKTSLAAVFGDGQKGMLSGGTGLLDQATNGTGQQVVVAGAPVSTNTNPSAATQTQTGAAGMPQPASAASGASTSGYTAQDVSQEVSTYHHIEQAIKQSLAAKGLSGAVRFAITDRGLIVTLITSALVFPGNSATLLGGGQQILASVAPALATQDKRKVEVDGYTNQEKASTYPYPTGWELSSARASAVVRYLSSHGVAEDRLSAVGLNDLNPLYPPSDPRSTTLNRRVEIVILSSLPSTAGAALKAAGQS